MFAVPCSWQPPPDAADAVGANAKSATTAASPANIDFLDTSTSIYGTRNAVHVPPLLPASLAGSENRRGGTLTSRVSGRAVSDLTRTASRSRGNRRISLGFLRR